jgi:predicted ATPase
MDLGNFNVLIGENGCGKSNILEAIALGAAASADKLDFEFLGSRGIRITNPEFMFSAFSDIQKDGIIRLDFNINDDQHYFELTTDPRNPKKWIDKTKEKYNEILTANLKALREFQDILIRLSELNEGKENPDKKQETSLTISEIKKEISTVNSKIATLFDEVDKISLGPELSNYIIYSPEQSSLRRLEETTQIYPIGIKGEGLFQYLKELSLENAVTEIETIKDTLLFLDWYEDFKVPKELIKNEFALEIKDKYLSESLQYFDQRSTNEGFLFLLFYSIIFSSKITPSFFAIDNIDVSLNPKLCVQVIRSLSKLAAKHGKQVIITTHNPAILDGLNLKDDGQRLFVIRRNDEGHTKAKRIEYKTERDIQLSEAWTRGYIGGLPDNF